MRRRRRSGRWLRRLRSALVRTAAKSTPPCTANWARSSDGSQHKPLERLGNAKLPQLSLRECRYRWLRGHATTDIDIRFKSRFETSGEFHRDIPPPAPGLSLAMNACRVAKPA
jgi:hypothetical protein